MADSTDGCPLAGRKGPQWPPRFLGRIRSRRSHCEYAGGVLLALLLKGVLDLTYLLVLSKSFLDGYVLEPSPVRLFLSYAALLPSAAIMDTLVRKGDWASGSVVSLYYVLVALPMLTLYGMSGGSLPFLIAVHGALMLCRLVALALPVIELPAAPRQLATGLALAALAATVYVYGSLVVFGGMGRFNFDLYQVYEMRARLAESRIPLLGYLLPLQGYVLNPGALVIGLSRANWPLAALAFSSQVLLFALTGFKSYLFLPIIVVGVFYLSGRDGRLRIYLVGALAAVVCLYGAGELTDISIFHGVITRLLYVPAYLHGLYHDFFSQNPNMLMADGKLSLFFDNPYERSTVQVVALHYWGKIFSPNVGYLGDAYAHFGYLGMAAFSLALGCFLKVLDSISVRFDQPRIAVAIALGPSMALVNSALFTTLLTHGFIAALVMMWVYSGFTGEGRTDPVREVAANGR